MEKLKFLVVDDSTTMRRIVINSLKSLGYEIVAEAADGREALQKLLAEGADFVITDWNMPEMSGLELTKAIRANGQYVDLPILMVTTRAFKEDVVEAMKARVNNYIIKPFTPQGLKEKIEQILKSTSTSA